MRITVLGSASGLPVPHRNASSYLVESGPLSILMDAGEGVSRQLLQYGVDYNRIEAIFISHTHSDHVSGLFMMLQMMHLTGRKNPLSIYLPTGVADNFKNIFPYFQIYQEQWPFVFSIYPISQGVLLKQDRLEIEAFHNGHLAGNQALGEKYCVGTDSYSFFLKEEEDKGVLYTSDVDTLENFSDNPVDLKTLIVESTHISVENIIQFAIEKEVSQIILTHIPAEFEEKPLTRSALPSSISLIAAADGLIIEV